MFVKVKLEDQDNAKKPLIFSIDDAATIYNLKSSLESFVNIPVDAQVIQRMDRILDNCDELAKVVNLETDGDKMNGAAISLYTNNKFYCFLQFYNKNESDNQSNFFSQPSNAKKLPIDTLPQYIEQLDSDEYSTSSTSDSEISDDSSDNSVFESRSKRRKRVSESTEERSKPASPVVTQGTAPTATQQAQIVQAIPATPPAPVPNIHATQELQITAVNVSPQVTVALKKNDVEVSQEQPIAASIVASTKQQLTAAKESTLSTVEKPTAPYIAMKPEQRKYALVINKDIAEQNPNFGRLMAHFYGLFESSKSCGQLNFSESLSITEYDDQLWVLCEDNETCEWIAKGARMLSSYKCCSFVKYFGLSKCRVVLPQVVDGKELANIFQLLELQNTGLCTSKWCVVERTSLDPKSKEYDSQALTTLCKNEVLALYVDQESMNLIQQNGLKLKYCFWKLTFQFESKLNN
ncbi:uncharacterized protein LOC117573324 isoform X1 [Drosophila albomicans]|uniref:Uncharacterized protein LOC117573324 isoform X1 n=1 Tax=Drosophila albomicans TaxID=7291 RepID=A0A6P8XI22_DROAB|nr:uncharacterized protein LOC117573324 isoform X1 [Drosophila albomicans]